MTRSPRSMLHEVVTEVILVTSARGGLAYRIVSESLPAGVEPHAHAESLTRTPAWMLHSTAWRYQIAPPGVVLTWAALVDGGHDQDSQDVGPPQLTEPAGGTPDYHHRLSEADVVWHSIRHLAFLLDNDPPFAAAANERPGLATLIADAGQALAGAPMSQRVTRTTNSAEAPLRIDALPTATTR